MKLVGICSQVSFYVEPTIQTKTSISSTSFFRMSDFDNQYDNRFSFNNRFLIFPKKLSPLTLGINVGLLSKNKRNIFNLGLHGDGTSAGFDYRINGIDEAGNQTTYEGTMYTGRSFTNLFFNYKFRVNEKSKQFNWYIIAGFGAALRNKGSSYIFETGVVEGKINDSTNFLMESTNIRTSEIRNLMYNIGLQLDVNSPKGKYLFTSSLNYFHSSRTLTYISTTLSIYSNINSERFFLSNYSSGSGIYFQLSRRLQVYPWKMKKKGL